MRVLVLAALVSACHTRVPGDVQACPSDPLPAATPTHARQVVQSTHSFEITALAVSPDGALLATAGTDHSIRIWDVVRRKQLVMHRHAGDVATNLAWHGPREVLAANGPNGTTTVVRLDGTSGPGPTLTASAHALGGTGRARWIAAVAEGELTTFDGAGLPIATARVACGSCELVVSRDGDRVIADGALGLAIARDGAITSGGVVPKGAYRSPTLEYALDPVVDEQAVVSYTRESRGPVGPLHYRVYRGTQTVGELVVPVDENSYDIALSSDGTRVAFATGAGVRVWSVADGVELWHGKRFAHKVAFGDRDRLLVTSNGDGTFTTWDARTGRAHGTYGAQILRAHDLLLLDESTIALGDDVSVAMWSIDDARYLGQVFLAKRLQGNYHHSVRGNRLVAFNTVLGSPRCPHYEATIETWSKLPGAGAREPEPETPGWQRWPTVPGATFSACTNVPAPYLRDAAGGVVLATGPRAHLQATVPDGRVLSLIASPNDDPLGALLSSDGKFAADVVGDAAQIWSTATGKLAATIALPSAMSGNEWTSPTVAFAPDDHTVAVRSGSHVVVFDALDPTVHHDTAVGAEVTALSFGADAHVVIAGDTVGTLHVVRDGVELAHAPSDGGAIDALRFQPARGFVATVSEDGAARVWDGKTAMLRATLAAFEDDEWVIATPGGAYAGTNEVGDRIGWVFDDPPEYFGFEQFAAFRDDALVRARLHGETTRDARVAIHQPPHVEIIATTAREDGRAIVRVRVAAGSTVDRVRVFVEGRPVAEQRVCARATEVSLEVPLLAGNNRLHVIATDAMGFASNPAIVDVASPRADAPRGRLWIVAVGVSDYPHLLDDVALPVDRKAVELAHMQLPAARNDARGIAAAFGRLAGPGRTFRDPHVTVLVDGAATPAAIRAALGELAGMAKEDVAVVFLAGHGVKPDEHADMAFVTGDAHLTADGIHLGVASLHTAALGWTDLADGLARARGRVLVLLDACHSGHISQELVIPNAALASHLARGGRAGAIVFAAAKGRQNSFEPGATRGFSLDEHARQLVDFDTREPHGFFTGAILQALVAPESDADGDGVLELSELIDAVTERVSDASAKQQTPWVARRDQFGDFALAPVNR